MAVRRKPQMPRRLRRVATVPPAAKLTTRRRRTAPSDEWQRRVRPKLLKAAVVAAESVQWSPMLLETLMDELYVADGLEDLLSRRLRKLPVPQYPKAIAIAVLLRHSWRAHDLEWIIDHLGLKVARQ